MAPAPSDFTLIGTVLAVSIAIILLSGLALYVAFRLRETLREERGGGARAAKVAFLIGLLFLSGGVFYFFASGFGAQGGNTLTSTTTSISVSTTTDTSTSSSSSSSTSASTTSTFTTTASAPGSSLQMTVSYPTSVGVGAGFYIQFTVYNNGPSSIAGGSIDVGSLIYTFSITNATMCNPQCSAATWSGSLIDIGTVNPGATILTLGVKAPAQPAQYSGTATLYYQGVSQPTTVTIAIRVSGRP